MDNLADDPQHQRTRDRLIGALNERQHDTADPFLDAVNVEAYVREQLANRDGSYRVDGNFRWSMS